MQKNYNENLVAGAAIRDDKGRRISKLFEASHPKMTVGYAKNLIMPDTPTEQEFNFRQSGGGVIEDGVAVIDKVKGRSVVWNQKFPYDASKWSGAAGSMTIDGSVITLSCDSSYYVEKMTLDQCIIAGHKYYTRATIVETVGLSRISEGDTESFISSEAAGTYNSIKEASFNTTLKIVNAGGVGQGATFKDVLFVDLTQMFGAGNEPSTVEEFLSRKPKVSDEYAYNEGTIISNNVDSIETVGRNVWEETPNFHDTSMDSGVVIPILPNTQYCITCKRGPGHGYPDIKFFEENPGTNWNTWTSTIYATGVSVNGYHVFTTPANCHYMVFEGWFTSLYGTTTYQNDICINLSDPTINGQYFPYEKHELDLSWVKEIKDVEGVKLFEDGIKSAGTAFDEVRKDKAVKRLGLVKMKDLNWELNTSYDWGNSFSAPLADMKPVVSVLSYGNILYRLGVSAANDINPNNESYLNKVYGIVNESKIGFASVIQDASQLIASFTEEDILIYELAEPIEVEYDEKNLTYPVVAGGTEEAIASEPSTAFRADIGYGIDAVKTILDLKARVEALERK